MTEKLDLEHLRSWIGNEETATDLLTPALAERFHDTIGLSGAPAREGEPAGRLIHFCLCQPSVPMDQLGADGHPARGGFLPPVPLPRRMWAGSRIEFTGDLAVGDTVERRSRIADVVVKEGRSGTLCFVTVDHEVSGGAGVAVKERQTLVYRAMEGGAATPATPAEPAPQGNAFVDIDPAPPLLFRYSALTFNGHRIHYDHPYASQVEGYPGLVVHGPLTASLLLQLAAERCGENRLASFRFRGLSPAIAGEPLHLVMRAEGGAIELAAFAPDGRQITQASAEIA